MWYTWLSFFAFITNLLVSVVRHFCTNDFGFILVEVEKVVIGDCDKLTQSKRLTGSFKKKSQKDWVLFSYKVDYTGSIDDTVISSRKESK